MAAKKDKMIPSEKERKRALKYATPAGTGQMWVTMGIAFIIFGIILLLIPNWPCYFGGISAEIRPRKHPYSNTCILSAWRIFWFLRMLLRYLW